MRNIGLGRQSEINPSYANSPTDVVKLNDWRSESSRQRDTTSVGRAHKVMTSSVRLMCRSLRVRWDVLWTKWI